MVRRADIPRGATIGAPRAAAIVAAAHVDRARRGAARAGVAAGSVGTLHHAGARVPAAVGHVAARRSGVGAHRSAHALAADTLEAIGAHADRAATAMTIGRTARSVDATQPAAADRIAASSLVADLSLRAYATRAWIGRAHAVEASLAARAVHAVAGRARNAEIRARRVAAAGRVARAAGKAATGSAVAELVGPAVGAVTEIEEARRDARPVRADGVGRTSDIAAQVAESDAALHAVLIGGAELTFAARLGESRVGRGVGIGVLRMRVEVRTRLGIQSSIDRVVRRVHARRSAGRSRECDDERRQKDVDAPAHRALEKTGSRPHRRRPPHLASHIEIDPAV